MTRFKPVWPRRFYRLVVTVATGLGCVTAHVALAQPAAPVAGAPLRIVVGFPAGGGADLLARSIADKLKDGLGRPIFVDNRPGAGGQVAAQYFKTLPADENAVMMANDHGAVMIPLTMKQANYSARDFVPVAEVAQYRLAITVNASSAASDLSGYLMRARTDPKEANYGIPAPGSLPQFIGFVLGASAGVALNPVPYRGGAPLNTDLLGNQIPASVDALGNVLENHRSRKFRVLAVSGERRSVLLPDIPTFDELGVKGLDRDGWVGIYAPAGTSEAFVSRFNAALYRTMQDAEVRTRLTALGFEPLAGGPKELAERAVKDTAYWEAVVKRSGFQAQ